MRLRDFAKGANRAEIASFLAEVLKLFFIFGKLDNRPRDTTIPSSSTGR